MLNENKLDNVKERIDVMIKAMTHIDESKLSNASILMLINALDAISSLSSDLLRSYVWYIKKYGSGNLNKLETNAVLFQEMADGVRRNF
ncbi:MAG: hypothetical protein K2G41_04745 [Duncaniella sp.]|uniref:hypothetical protein n=1 Tax=Duncaniella sp. TaxID=2518496 RepID=UPI0023D2FD4B|nr:hypothetical protein [Duncaniella sp.]MDE6089989.1 hypothetical protein [Duncaniella sp.]